MFLTTGLTNTRTEGTNRLIKQVKSAACGVRNRDSSIVGGSILGGDHTCPKPPGPMPARLPRISLSPDVGRTCLGYRQDRAIPPFAQRKLARLPDAQVQQIDGGHDGMVSNPVGTAAALNQSAPESARTDLKSATSLKNRNDFCAAIFAYNRHDLRVPGRSDMSTRTPRSGPTRGELVP